MTEIWAGEAKKLQVAVKMFQARYVSCEKSEKFQCSPDKEVFRMGMEI